MTSKRTIEYVFSYCEDNTNVHTIIDYNIII